MAAAPGAVTSREAPRTDPAASQPLPGDAGHAGRSDWAERPGRAVRQAGRRGAGREARWRSALAGAAEAEAGRRPVAMLRRKPTRLELKLDDIEEFESIRKDLEVRAEPAAAAPGASVRPGPGAA